MSKPPKPLTKVVAYAYPTSTTATKLGFGKAGCWCVMVGHVVEGALKSGPESKAFDTKEEALAHAESLPYPYGPWSHTPEGVTDHMGRLNPKETK